MSLFRVEYSIYEGGVQVSKTAAVTANSRYDAKKVLKRILNSTRSDLVEIDIKQIVSLEDANGKSCV